MASKPPIITKSFCHFCENPATAGMRERGRGGTNVDREHDDLIRAQSFRLGRNVGLNGLIIQNLKYRYRESRLSFL
jgi:hypothetical protein